MQNYAFLCFSKFDTLLYLELAATSLSLISSILMFVFLFQIKVVVHNTPPFLSVNLIKSKSESPSHDVCCRFKGIVHQK